MMQFKFIDLDGPEYEQEKMLRWEVLLKPLGLPPEAEMGPDDKCLHLVALEKKNVIGCLCFYPENRWKGELFHMAVSEEYRGRGFGRQLLHKMENTLCEKGVKQVFVYAWKDVENFYTKMGFHAEEEYTQRKGTLCRLMNKNL